MKCNNILRILLESLSTLVVLTQLMILYSTIHPIANILETTTINVLLLEIFYYAYSNLIASFATV